MKQAVVLGIGVIIGWLIVRWVMSGIPSIGRKEGFVSKKCPDGTRSDGPCLMEFPSF